ncbi:unnamed protein product [Leptidea sinapis]|uniref:Uncharacterized protein n=1 Tax=Leptidea sinapis TaxID=189913 RepID=A0A5E4QVJ3_9NEOP|nr:unnamed protein product [Leptidea sinapis]
MSFYHSPEAESNRKQLLRDLLIAPGDGPSDHSILSSIAFEALLLNCSRKLSICVSILVGELAICAEGACSRDIKERCLPAITSRLHPVSKCQMKVPPIDLV